MANDRAAGRAAVREVLARIVASRAFEKSERARELLNFVVNEEQAGRGDRLKAFTIAVDVFGKDASFDASSDPLVRVHAGRVRELLEQYYEEEGAGERLRILIPKGGYVPVYEEVEPHPAAFRKTVDSTTLAGVLGDHARDTSEDGISAALRGAIGGQTSVVTFASPSPAQKAGGNVDGETISKSRRQPRTASDETGLAPQILRHMKLYWLAIATIIVMLAYVVYSLLGEQAMVPVTTAEVNAPSRGHRGSITSDLLPSVGIVAEDDKPETVLVANELQNMLPKFDTIRLITGDGSTSTTNYRFSVISVAPGKAAVRLVNVASGEVVMTSEVDTSVRAALDVQMARIGSSTATDGGAIFADVAANDNANSLTRCIILNHEYFRDQTDALHREAWDCFDGIAKRGVKSPLVYAELASLMVESVADKRGYPLDASMEQAQRYAEQALSRGPQSAHAHRAMGYVLARQGAETQALRWSQSAHELNPYNLDFTASYGYALVYAGRYGEGSKLLKRAVDNAGQFQSWWVYGLACGLLMEKRPQEAFAYSELVRSRSTSHYIALRLILANQTGKSDVARQLLEELQSRNTSFTRDPEAFYVKAKYPADLTKSLVQGLAKAGFVKAPPTE